MVDELDRDEFLTVDEAAIEFRLSTSAIYRALREQRLPGIKILGRWRISRAELLGHAARESRARVRRDPMPTPRPANSRTRFRAKAHDLRDRMSV